MARMSAKEFDRVLQDAIASLPDEFRKLLDVVPVVVDPWPAPGLQQQEGDAHELFGLFVGPPVAEWESTDAPPEAAMIYVFQGPLEQACADRKELADQIRITLLHELGHCLGFDEDGLDRIGLA